jgi:Lrp/AsnC family transcriptional regulator for asnA, asnC and gidA
VATVGIRVAGDPRVVAQRLADQEAIEWVVITAGSFDLLVEIVCHSEAELLGVIAERIRSVPEVSQTETFMHLHTEENVFAWDRRLARSDTPKPHRQRSR